MFTIALEALSGHFRKGLALELFYADDMVLLTESRELLKGKIRIWKEGLESKGLRVNVGKTKVMRCHVSASLQLGSGHIFHLCGICGNGVSRDSIHCGGVRNGSMKNAVG